MSESERIRNKIKKQDEEIHNFGIECKKVLEQYGYKIPKDRW